MLIKIDLFSSKTRKKIIFLENLEKKSSYIWCYKIW